MTQRTILYNAAKAYLKSQMISFTEDPEALKLRYTAELSNALDTCAVTVSADEKGLYFVAVSPVKAQAEALPATAEFITRANWGMKLGGFELDYASGAVRYKTYLRCDSGVPSLSDLQFCNDVCFTMFRRYGDYLLKNLTGAGNPAADVREAEKP